MNTTFHGTAVTVINHGGKHFSPTRIVIGKDASFKKNQMSHCETFGKLGVQA